MCSVYTVKAFTGNLRTKGQTGILLPQHPKMGYKGICKKPFSDYAKRLSLTRAFGSKSKQHWLHLHAVHVWHRPTYFPFHECLTTK